MSSLWETTTTETTTTGLILKKYSEVPSWEDFQWHIALAFGSFAFLSILSLAMANCRSSWNGDTIDKKLRPWVRIIGTSRLYLPIIAAIAFMMCVLHVMRVESDDEFGNGLGVWEDVEAYCVLVHLAETVILWLHATARSTGGLSGIPVTRLALDCAILPSVLFRCFGGRQKSHFSFAYVAALRLTGIWGVFRSTLSVFMQTVKLQLLHAFVVLATFIFFVAMLVQQVETLSGDPWPFQLTAAVEAVPAQRWSLSSSAYFVLVTVTTVGYGDLWPQSVFGQLLTAFISTTGIYVTLKSFIGVHQALRVGMGGGGEYPRGTRNKHAIVTGSPSYQVLCDFVAELFHEDHAQEAEDLNLVLLFPANMSHTMDSMKRWFGQAQNRHIQHKVWVLQGSALKKHDLHRVGYQDASMAWLLPNLYSADSEHEDTENAMRALAMRKHTPYVRIVALAMKAESRGLLSSVGVQKGDILCADELKLGMMGKACQVQGFVPWVSILFKNTKMPDFLANDVTAPPWMFKYAAGLANEIYEVSLSKAYIGAPFGAIAIDVLTRSGGNAFMVGVVEEAIFPGDETVTKLFPGRAAHVGQAEDFHCKGLFIASCREAVVQHPPNVNFAWAIDGVAPPAAAASAASASAAAAASLPNAVPEPLAKPGEQGAVKEDWELRAESAAKTAENMYQSALKRAVKSLTVKTNLTMEAAADFCGDMPEGGLGLGLDMDDGAAGTDIAKKLFSQQLEAQREAEREAEAVQRDAEIAAEARAMAVFARAMNLIDAEEDGKWKALAPTEEEKHQDDELWGGSAPPPPKLFRSPKEPPPALLVRGGHILVLALDGSTNNEEGGPAMSLVKGKPGQQVAPPGRRMSLALLLESLRAGVPSHRARKVVVLANEVPFDWPKHAADKGVYLVLGPPLSGSGLRRAGLQESHTVIVQQRVASATDDPSTVDSQAVFAVRLVESLVTAAGKDIPVLCDLMLERNAFFTPLITRRKTTTGRIVVLKETNKHKHDNENDEDEEEGTKQKMHVEDTRLPFYMQTRFANGQLFVSSVVTATVANMMYNPALGSIFQEMLKSGYRTIPVPDDWTGKAYQELYGFILRRKNLLPVALLRKWDCELFDDDEDEVDIKDVKDVKAGKDGKGPNSPKSGPAGPANPLGPLGKELPPLERAKERWSPLDCPSSRCVLVMPPGDTRVAEHDGVVCVLPADAH